MKDRQLLFETSLKIATFLWALQFTKACEPFTLTRDWHSLVQHLDSIFVAHYFSFANNTFPLLQTLVCRGTTEVQTLTEHSVKSIVRAIHAIKTRLHERYDFNSDHSTYRPTNGKSCTHGVFLWSLVPLGKFPVAWPLILTCMKMTWICKWSLTWICKWSF